METESVVMDYSNLACTIGKTHMNGMECIEEFIENSISAGATDIIIKITKPYVDENTCIDVIKVVIKDNGCGIDLDILKHKFLSIGQSGLKQRNSMSIHGVGGSQSIFVIQTDFPNWRVETKTESSIKDNKKYILNGPIYHDTQNCILISEMSDKENKIPGTEINVSFNSCFFPGYYVEAFTFEYFIRRIHERLGIKYFELLQDNRINIKIEWTHNGEKKCGKEEIKPPANGVEIIKGISWRDLTIRSDGEDGVPIVKELTDPIHKLKHIQYSTRLIEHFKSEKALAAGLTNYQVFPLKHHYQNIIDSECIYLYYRGMLFEKLRISDISKEINNKVFDYSKFVCIIELDKRTDPNITNIIKTKARMTHPHYKFLRKELENNLRDVLETVFPNSAVVERDIKVQIRERFKTTFTAGNLQGIKIYLESKLKWGPVDILIHDSVNKKATYMEVKKGTADGKDFIQIKDYSDQYIIDPRFDHEHEVTFKLVALTFSENVIERSEAFNSKGLAKIELHTLGMVNNNKYFVGITPFLTFDSNGEAIHHYRK